eukprot:CAMPEP_0168386062 /NCGR_PEP_ID=MMETSP0228-20121227/15236_1 /TAXON_ID=133427 /ORGANISM="Protoceratium reticulatum, Strain CCCM 535 (=CCMP 1889)" /LENGTH=225 /DNA_ID=CAMNT_0008399255 /DNA_START=38 /DNA_END=715 /DNA_ORIENTATION=+
MPPALKVPAHRCPARPRGSLAAAGGRLALAARGRDLGAMMPMLQVDLVDLAPTEYALRMRPAFMAMLFALGTLCVGKFMIHDFWGAVNLFFVVLMGVFVLSGQYTINASSAPWFCLMAAFSGIFDVVSCVLYFNHSTYRMFDFKAPALVLLAQAVFLLSPAALLASAILAYTIFIDCRNNSQESAPLAATLARMEWEGQFMRPPQPPPAPREPAPFQGHGQRLGD